MKEESIIEHLGEVRDQRKAAWESALVDLRLQAIATVEQLRQATEAYYFEGGRKCQ